MDCVSDCYDEFAERQKQCPCEVNDRNNDEIFSQIFAKLTFFRKIASVDVRVKIIHAAKQLHRLT